jgi:hypothetical protein
MKVQTGVTENINKDDQAMTNDAEKATDASATAPFSENLSIEKATADNQRAMSDYRDEYPFNMHFHLDLEIPILAFDPSVVQDSFDPFELTDYVNMEED